MGNRERKRIQSYRDLEVYQLLFRLALEIHRLSLKFPKFEVYELGSQIRRSSNSAPANLAEGWNNIHINIYIEGVNRSLSEVQETLHHLEMAFKKGYLTKDEYDYYTGEYEKASRMLKSLEESLIRHRENK